MVRPPDLSSRSSSKLSKMSMEGWWIVHTIVLPVFTCRRAGNETQAEHASLGDQAAAAAARCLVGKQGSRCCGRSASQWQPLARPGLQDHTDPVSLPLGMTA